MELRCRQGRTAGFGLAPVLHVCLCFLFATRPATWRSMLDRVARITMRFSGRGGFYADAVPVGHPPPELAGPGGQVGETQWSGLLVNEFGRD